MPLEKQPFRLYNLDNKQKPDSFTVRLNKEEREALNKAKLIIEQTKDSTALKTLAWIGAKVLHTEPTPYLLALVFKNKRNNKRLGIADFD